MIERVFVALDGSAEARSVLPWLEAWGLKSPKFILFHCLRSHLATGETLGNSRFETPERAREYLADLARKIPGEPEIMVRSGFPGDRIVTAALQSNADLVVLGDAADPGQPRGMGRITEMVAKTCPLPLLLVRTPLPAPVRRVRRILAPLDGRTGGGEDMELLRGVAKALHSEVVLLHVDSLEPEVPEAEPPPPRDAGPDDPDAQLRLMTQVWNFLKDSIAVSDVRLNLIQQVWAFLKKEIAARTVMTKGSFVEETLGHERSLDADVVAVARRAGTGRDWATIVGRSERAVLLYETHDLDRTSLLPAVREQHASPATARSVSFGATLEEKNFLKSTQHS